MAGLDTGSLDRRVEIQSRSGSTAFMGAGQGTWATIANGTVWASVQDVLPSRAENVADGINITRRPARVRMRWRDDVTGQMRLKMGERIMQIVAGPTEIGRREGLELMVEEYAAPGEAP